MTKFIEWRNNERKRRTEEKSSMDEAQYFSDIHNHLQSREYNIDNDTNASDDSEQIEDLLVSSTRNLKALDPNSSNNRHTNQQTIEDIYRYTENPNSGVRHSMPSNMSRNYKAKPPKRKKGRAPARPVNPNVIHEDEVKEFEGSHCQAGGISVSESPPNIFSPPTKFYKMNSNPYPVMSSESDSYGTTQPLPATNLQNCPVKPKRLMLKQQNVQQNTKELSEAHFNGAYQNYEVHSPYYEDKGRDFAATNAADLMQNPGKSDGRQSPQYQTIINKHGEMVEYAVPYCEQRKHNLPVDDHPTELEDEVFQEDAHECEKIINDNFRFLGNEKIDENSHVQDNNRSSLYTKRPRKKSEHVLITDLDKSMDSSNTMDGKRQSHDILDELNSLSKWSENLTRNVDPKSTSQAELLDMLFTVKSAMPCCRTKELKPKISVLQNTFPSPVEIVSGVFRKTTVTLRNYPITGMEFREESTSIATEAVKRDFEILR